MKKYIHNFIILAVYIIIMNKFKKFMKKIVPATYKKGEDLSNLTVEKIVIPKDLTEKEIDLYKQLAELRG